MRQGLLITLTFISIISFASSAQSIVLPDEDWSQPDSEVRTHFEETNPTVGVSPDEDPQTQLQELRTKVATLESQVETSCKVALSHSIKVPRVERSQDLEDSLELVRDYEQPTFYVRPHQPLVIQFPKVVLGGYKSSRSSMQIEKKGNTLVLFVNQDLADEGEALIAQTEDNSFYGFRLKMASPEHPVDVKVKLQSRD